MPLLIILKNRSILFKNCMLMWEIIMRVISRGTWYALIEKIKKEVKQKKNSLNINIEITWIELDLSWKVITMCQHT